MLAVTLTALSFLLLLGVLSTMRRVYLNIVIVLMVLVGISCVAQPVLDPIVGPKVIGPTSEWLFALLTGALSISFACFAHWISTAKLTSLR